MDLLDLKRDELRARLNEVLVDNPLSIRKLAVEVGLTVPTMLSFVKGKRPATIKTIAILEKYLRSKEKDNNDYIK